MEKSEVVIVNNKIDTIYNYTGAEESILLINRNKSIENVSVFDIESKSHIVTQKNAMLNH